MQHIRVSRDQAMFKAPIENKGRIPEKYAQDNGRQVLNKHFKGRTPDKYAQDN